VGGLTIKSTLGLALLIFVTGWVRLSRRASTRPAGAGLFLSGWLPLTQREQALASEVQQRKAEPVRVATVVPKRAADLELDEFWSFVEKKKRQRWTWYAFDRQRKRVTAFVNGRRTDHNCAALLKKLADSRVQRFHTDKWESYLKLLPGENHLIGKEGTRNIERHNLNFRTHVKRLQRRTICFSKSVEMHDAVIKLYVRHSNFRQHHI